VAKDGYYEIMGVGHDASLQEIRTKYRDLIRRTHPDLDGPVALFRQVQEAYEVLSDPARRAEYDHRLAAERTSRRPAASDPHSRTRDPRPSSARAWQKHVSTRSVGLPPSRRGPQFRSFPSQNPAGAIALAGAVLVVFGAALGDAGWALVGLGWFGLALGVLAGIGRHGTRKLQAYQRSGMAAIDAMSSREFEDFLGHLFVRKGYRVARLGSRGHGNANLLLAHSGGPTVVQVQRRFATVNHEAVQHAADAMDRFRATRALVVTSSIYSQRAITLADSSNVTLWNRSTLASELAAIQREDRSTGVRRLIADLRAGGRVCLGMWVAALAVLSAMSWRLYRRKPTARYESPVRSNFQ